jgi:aspartate-semialdehyde dehydrogenase
VTRVGVLPAGTLLGRELAARIAEALPHADLHLLTRDPDAAGTLAEAGEAAALLELADAESLGRLDVLVASEAQDDEVDGLLAALRPTARLLLVSPSRPLQRPEPLVAGVKEASASDGRVIHSPHAVTVAVSLLLEPLLDLAPTRVVVTAIEPVSGCDPGGIDELVAQTRALLTFQPVPEERLGAQLAFNLVPETGTSSAVVGEQLRDVLGGAFPIEVTLLRAGVFHGVAIAVTCTFETPPDPSAVRNRLERAPFVSLSPAGEKLPGSKDAAIHEEALVAELPAGSEARTVRFWIAVDHLVRGGAANAAALLVAALESAEATAH